MRSAENQRRGPGGEDDTAFGEESLRGFSGFLGSTGQRAGFLRRSQGGQKGQKSTDGEKFRRRTELPAAALRGNPGAGVDRGQGSELGELPGLEAELLCGSGEVVVQWSSAGTAAQDSAPAELRRRGG